MNNGDYSGMVSSISQDARVLETRLDEKATTNSFGTNLNERSEL